MTTWKEKFSDFLVSISESLGIHIIDFFAFIFIPLLYFSLKKYFEDEKEISFTDKMYDASLVLVALIIYIIFFLGLFGIVNY